MRVLSVAWEQGLWCTDSVASPVPQLVKTFTNAGKPVKLITESPDGANTGPPIHSSHFKNSGWIYPDYRPVDCDKSDKKKQPIMSYILRNTLGENSRFLSPA